MISALRYLLVACLLSASVARAQGAPADARLELGVDTPSVQIETRRPGRNFISLPDLEYRFVISARCATNMTPTSLLLSVADARRSLLASEIPADGELEIELGIPAGQLAPIALERFCVTAAGDADETGESEQPESDTGRSMHIPAVVSASASLLCGSAESASRIEMRGE